MQDTIGNLLISAVANKLTEYVEYDFTDNRLIQRFVSPLARDELLVVVFRRLECHF
jgi:hypothetical protein